MTEIIKTESPQEELASDDFLLYDSPKKKQKKLSKAFEFPQLHGVAQNSWASNAKGKLKKVFNVHKENISAAYNISDIEIEEPPPTYDRDTKNKDEEFDRLHAN